MRIVWSDKVKFDGLVEKDIIALAVDMADGLEH